MNESTQEAAVSITPEIAAWVAAEAVKPSNSTFMFDMHMKIQQDALTPNMEAAIIRSFEKSQVRAAEKIEREAKLATAPALEAGRRPLSGKVISAKFKESQFGTQAKMLLELEDGNRVWGTVPAALLVNGYDLPESGTRMSFVATVEVSAEDNHFGFYSRPKVGGGAARRAAVKRSDDPRYPDPLDQNQTVYKSDFYPEDQAEADANRY